MIISFLAKSESRSIVSNSLRPHGSDSSIHGILQAKILEWVAVPFSSRIFPTQGSNLGLLHCRWVLYQLSYQESPGKFSGTL